MCTGAEPAAAGAAKGATDIASYGAAAAASDAVAGGAMSSLAAGGTGALTAGEMAAMGTTAAAADLAGTAGAAAATGAAAPAAGTSTLAKLSAGASVANAGLGMINALQGRKVPAAPSLTAPIVMPTPDDIATQRARSAMIAKLSQQRGRTSTILSNDTLGGN